MSLLRSETILPQYLMNYSASRGPSAVAELLFSLTFVLQFLECRNFLPFYIVHLMKNYHKFTVTLCMESFAQVAAVLR